MPNDWARRRLQFRTLYRVFLLRVVDLELLSADGDPTKLIGQFATIFVSISFFFTLPALLALMGASSSPGTEGWTFEHFFIETAMTCAGLIAVLNWEAAFPDKRDLLVLAPLPVRKSTLFLAKIAALFAAPALAVAALNSLFRGRVAVSLSLRQRRILRCVAMYGQLIGSLSWWQALFLYSPFSPWKGWRPIYFRGSFFFGFRRFCKQP